MKSVLLVCLSVFMVFAAGTVLFVPAVEAQTTAFTYQGRMTDGSVTANGIYGMKFRLYDAGTGNNQIGAEVSLPTVTIANGIFTVSLDFGANAFAAAGERWLEIEVGATVLSPRQKITASPFAIRSLESNKADLLSSVCNPCVTDPQIASISGAKVSGTVSNATTAASVTGIVPIANGGTGSAIKNFVDLSTSQTGIAGNKDFTGNVGIGGPAVPGQPLTAYNASGNAALQTTSLGIQLGDVNGASFGNYLDINFESVPKFRFIGADVETANITATGNVQVPAANDYKYATPKTQYYSVAAAAFTPESSAFERGFISGNIYAATGNANTVGFFDAPVNLPDGATVTSVAFYVVDNDGTFNLQPGQLWRNDASTSSSFGNSTTMATTPTPASSNSTLVQIVSTSTISSPVINNQVYSYYLRWGTQQSNSNMRLLKVLITYTVTKVD